MGAAQTRVFEKKKKEREKKKIHKKTTTWEQPRLWASEKEKKKEKKKDIGASQISPPLDRSPWSSWWRSHTAACSWTPRWTTDTVGCRRDRTTPPGTRRCRRCGCSSRWHTAGGRTCRRPRRSSQGGSRPHSSLPARPAGRRTCRWRGGRSRRFDRCQCTRCCSLLRRYPGVMTNAVVEGIVWPSS